MFEENHFQKSKNLVQCAVIIRYDVYQDIYYQYLYRSRA